ncbi:MAG: gamma-glutamyltransferase, partial [Gammaproteobacteria bacterium]
GLALNNALGEPELNRRGLHALPPGTRLASNMAPTTGRRDDGSMLAIGSPGGPSIINYVARSLIAILDDGVEAQAAVAMANLGNRNGPTELELGVARESLAEALRARGHDVRFVEMTSGLHAVAVDCPPRSRHHRDCTLTGAVDPRREGAVSTQGLQRSRIMERRRIGGGNPGGSASDSAPSED